MSAKSIDDLVACAKRELRLRQRKYPEWVLAGRMKEQQSQHEIDCMQQIVETLEAMQPAKPEQGSLL